jgi:hypothetical protein
MESGNQEIKIFRNYIDMEVSQTKKAQMERWTNMIESEDFKRVCRNSDWNPSDERLNQIKLDVFEVSEESRKLKDDAYVKEQKDKIHRRLNVDCVLITISLDQSQSEEEAIENQYKVIEDIKKAKYSWMVNPECVFEYWGSSMQDPPTADLASNMRFNPHIHIVVHKTCYPKTIRQNLLRKFVLKKKHSVYNHDVRVIPRVVGEDYVNGDKREDKCDKVEMDMKTREKYGVPHKISI